jgi:DNA-binding transcriptional LysR family regulator
METPRRRPYKELTLQQLRSFCEVCERGGYAAAARELNLTSPAVWEQVQGLERHYGVRLLERQGHGVRPTVAGVNLLAIVRPLLAGLASSRDVLRQQDGAAPTELTLATNLRVLTEEISLALRRFHDQAPQVRLRVIYTGDDVEARVLGDAADVGFTLEPGPDAPPMSALTHEPAGAVDYLLVTPPEHPLLQAKSLSLAEVVRHPLVLGHPEGYSRRRVQEILHRDQLTGVLDVAVETNSDEYTLSCVRAGLGIGITIGTGRGHLYRGLGVRSLEPWFGAARVGFVWKRGAHLPPAQRALADAIRASIDHAGDGEPR